MNDRDSVESVTGMLGICALSARKLELKLERLLLRLIGFVWFRTPTTWHSTALFRATGHYVHRQVTRLEKRGQSHSTWFLRNIPMIETITALVKENFSPSNNVQLASIACSTGAELYSQLYFIRSACSEPSITAVGADVSEGVVKVAREAVYSLEQPSSTGVGKFPAGEFEMAHIPDEYRLAMFERTDQTKLRIKNWIRAGTSWLTADATDPVLIDKIGLRDVVLANNFLGPMDDELAESCLRNVSRLVKPGGFLVVDGVDLDVRMTVMKQLGYEPVLSRYEEIYWADPTKHNWPWERWAHEPIDLKVPDWQFRYSAIFRKPLEDRE
jgi:chemotaxis methyl-accepting protein methylase